jgi:orotidine-5'-phosphate decarboxylase
MSESKVLVALDVDRLHRAGELISELAGHVHGFKIGMELCSAEGVPAVVEQVSKAGGAVFLDLKFKDIPNTVYGAVKACCRAGVFMLNIHCDGGLEMMKAAVKAASESNVRPLVIGVTVLTSISEEMLNNDLGVPGQLQSHAVRLAKLAKQAGLDGVVCSPFEVREIKSACGDDFITVVPGVRPQWAAAGDQKRFMSPSEASAAGADYLVIGRPITNPPETIGSPQKAAIAIMQELQAEKAVRGA